MAPVGSEPSLSSWVLSAGRAARSASPPAVAIRVADNLDAVAVLGEAVDKGDDARRTGERVAPLLEGEIGSEQRLHIGLLTLHP